jgi:hypothetical protein
MSYSSGSGKEEEEHQQQQRQQQQEDFEYKDIEFQDDTNANKEGIEMESMSTPHYHRLTFISLNACDFCTHVRTPGPY